MREIDGDRLAYPLSPGTRLGVASRHDERDDMHVLVDPQHFEVLDTNYLVFALSPDTGTYHFQRGRDAWSIEQETQLHDVHLN